MIKMIYTPPDTPVVGVSGIYDVCEPHTSI
nr:MAG TPA: hypothetical protein [Caudoviricetes sp.]